MNLEQVKQLKVGDGVILPASAEVISKVLFIAKDVIVLERPAFQVSAFHPLCQTRQFATSMSDIAAFRAWRLPRKPFDETLPYVHPVNTHTTGIQLRETPSGSFEIAWIGNYPPEYAPITREQLKLRAELFLRAYNHPQATTPLTLDFVPQSDPTKE